MRGKWVLCILLLVMAMSVFVAQAESDIARVDITSEEILLLTNKSQKAKGYFVYHAPDGTEASGYVTAKVMGTQSLSYPKKNYNIRFYEDAECTKSCDIQFVENWGAQQVLPESKLDRRNTST